MSAREPELCKDDRGAIMVMGIFMCLLLVGALWYIAGIGDALMFRERMQEAADSTAFSAAIIQARGMNIIVMINLIMAAILAIRVAINMCKLVLTVLAAAFWAIAAIPFCEWAAVPAEACTDGAVDMQELDEETTTPINDALMALNKAWTAIEYATPIAAIAGAMEMESKYSPPVANPPVIPPWGKSVEPGVGLPVTADTLDKLCDKAAEDVGSLFSLILGPTLGGIVGGAISSVASMAPGYFCELPGSTATPPNLSSLACGNANSQVCDNADAATQTYNSLVAADASAAAISAAQTKMNSLDNSCSNSNSAAAQNCQDAGASTGTSGTITQGDGGTVNTKNTPNGNGSNGSSGSMNPAGVASSWYNGIADAQILSGLLSDGAGESQLNVSPRLVSMAGHNPGAIGGPNALKGQTASWSQAEFFYDQAGAWSGLNPDAMWNFYWRARFRMSNPNALTSSDAAIVAAAADAASVQYGAAVLADGIQGLSSTNMYTGAAKFGLASALKTTATTGMTIH
jgi:hypothetical protein